MGCDSKHAEDDTVVKEFQNLDAWKGPTLQVLLARLAAHSNDRIRIYTVATTRLKRETQTVCQIGSGPNLEGSVATLCTCKHSMRQSHSAEDWKGKWVLGLTARAKSKGFAGTHFLFYLMKVAAAFNSHSEMYAYLSANNNNALLAKNAIRNRLGDVYEPRPTCNAPLNPLMYKPPHNDHTHGRGEQWHDDIIYGGKSSPLLLGDVSNTFVWPKPLIKFRGQRGVGNMKLTIGEDLFSLLESD